MAKHRPVTTEDLQTLVNHIDDITNEVVGLEQRLGGIAQIESAIENIPETRRAIVCLIRDLASLAVHLTAREGMQTLKEQSQKLRDEKEKLAQR